MPISEARKRANKKWNDANLKERYDRIQVVVPKGQKEVIQAHAAAVGMSVNAYINQAIQAYMGRGNAPETASGAISPPGGTDSTGTPESASGDE